MYVDSGGGDKKFGDRCESSSECGVIGGYCDPSKKTCQCNPDLQVTNHIDRCGKGEFSLIHTPLSRHSAAYVYIRVQRQPATQYMYSVFYSLEMEKRKRLRAHQTAQKESLSLLLPVRHFVLTLFDVCAARPRLGNTNIAPGEMASAKFYIMPFSCRLGCSTLI